MSKKTVCVDSNEIDIIRWEGEGGAVFDPDQEHEKEDRRLQQAELRNFLKQTVGNEDEFCLVLALATEEITAAAYGRMINVHRATAGRLIEKIFRRLSDKIATSPGLLAIAPPEVLKLLNP